MCVARDWGKNMRLTKLTHPSFRIDHSDMTGMARLYLHSFLSFIRKWQSMSHEQERQHCQLLWEVREVRHSELQMQVRE